MKSDCPACRQSHALRIRQIRLSQRIHFPSDLLFDVHSRARRWFLRIVLALDVIVLGVTSKLCLQSDALLACKALSEFVAAFEFNIGNPTAAHRLSETCSVSVSLNRQMQAYNFSVCETAYAEDNQSVKD